jgi:two-component system KDP operon response regulator KdpE
MPGRILVIDDEPQITRVLRAALSAQGFDVRTANDPEEGLRTFKEWSPDLVITDLMMPGMSGVEVTRAIRQHAATPVLVLSVREHERSKVEALDAGADDYVTKPFEFRSCWRASVLICAVPRSALNPPSKPAISSST